jgi:hypothetical protein
VARLGAWMPFAPAAGMLAFFTGVHVSEATARRLTEQAGAVHVDLQTEAVERLEREAPPAPAGPAVQQLSVDGAMVPLVGGEWAEVKTLAIGTVTAPGHAEQFSYFSRLADAETFTRLATVETHRRGVETAGVVCAVADGAEWAQGFVDHHRPDAVRILDFPHAAGYLATAAQALFGPETPGGAAWLAAQRQELRHGDPARVAGKLRGLRDDLALAAGGRRPAAVAALTASLTYLAKRLPQLRYADFAAAGYPLGSGSVESANKLVVEARLKGGGMHWARAHVDPLVALRTVVCSDRWAEGWPAIHARWRQRGSRRRCAPPPVAPDPPPTTAAGAPPALLAALPASRHDPAALAPPPPARPAPAASRPARPAADHPWRRSLHARPRPPASVPSSART